MAPRQDVSEQAPPVPGGGRDARRRIVDALRFLPFAGILLWMVPLLWPIGEGGTGTAFGIVYVFGVWVLLIAASAWLSTRAPEDQLPDGHDAEPDGSLSPPELDGETGVPGAPEARR